VVTLTGLLAATSNVDEIKHGWGGIVFLGVFILACLIVGIWWLSR
jgi:hypothetical protein